MKYLSVCSGIEAATVAWEPLGWTPWAFSEIEKFPSAVLAYHYPDVPNLGDMTAFNDWPDADVDVLVGGTPCQSFSVAGLRKGLADPRGNLMLTYLAIARRYQPKWLVWENVPGVLSSKGGRDFGTFLGALGELGYGFAYRVLDAQYFGVPQRRRRVFVVAYLGDWRPAAAVLFERESLSGHPPPRRETGERTAPTISSRASYDRGHGSEPIVPVMADPLKGPGQNSQDTNIVAHSLGANAGRNQIEQTYVPVKPLVVGPLTRASSVGGTMTQQDVEANHLITHALTTRHGATEDGTGRGTPLVAQAFKSSHFTRGKDGKPDEVAPPLSADADKGDQDTLIFTGDGVVADPISANEQGTYTHEGDTFRMHNTVGVPIAQIIEADQGSGGNRSWIEMDEPHQTLKADAKPNAIAFAQNQRGELRTSDIAPQLTTGGGKPGEGYSAVAIQETMPTMRSGAPDGGKAHGARSGDTKDEYIVPVAFEARYARNDRGAPSEIVPPLKAQSGQTGKGDAAPLMSDGYAVRRLTPVECERLQGFPDGHTAIPWRGKPAEQCPDGPRYRVLGNSMATPVVRWLGERMDMVEAMMKEVTT